MKSIFEKTNCLNEQDMTMYLAEALDEDRRHQLENHLLDCALCSAALEGYAQAQKIDKKALQEDVVSLKKQMWQHNPEKNTRKVSATIWKRVAAIAFLLITLILISLYWKSGKNERLFAEYFEVAESTYQIQRGTRTIRPEMSSDLNMAMDYYEKEDYVSSLPYFEKYLKEKDIDYEAMFFAGIARLKTGDIPEAQRLLKQVRLNENERSQDAGWYLSLCLIKEKKENNARLLLRELMAAEQGRYKEKAESLLNKLR